MLRRNAEYAALYELVEKLRDTHRLNSRVVLPLFEAALGLRLTNARYQSLAEVAGNLASRDLKMLSDRGLLVPKGEKRGRTYFRSAELTGLRLASRQPSHLTDPFDIVAARVHNPRDQTPRLPGL